MQEVSTTSIGPGREVTASEAELLALIDEYERNGNEQGAARCRQGLEALRALDSGDVERVRKAERRLGRPIIGKVIAAPRRPVTTAGSPRRTSSSRPRERRERRAHSRGGDPGGGDDPPGRSTAGSRPRHISYALERVGFDPFRRPVDRLLAGLRAHSDDAYRLVPGERDEPDRWVARCPLHPDVGFTLVITDRGDDREPDLWCKVGCPSGIVRYALVDDPEREREAERRAAVLLWAQSFKNGRTA